MRQKLTVWLLLAREMNRYVPVVFALIAVASFVLVLPYPATGGGPGGGI